MMRKKAANEACAYWLSSDYFDEETKERLRALDDPKEIRERFGKDLEFGTGGMRGLLGDGTNRFNRYTVRRATQGLCDYIHSLKEADKGVVIAYDSRHGSAELSKEAALCLNAGGIRTWRFESLRPTPELSFAVRELGCIAGIVITASHNPREYNGYKVYWKDGEQITPPIDRYITEKISEIDSWEAVKTMKEEEAKACGLYHEIGEEMDQRYYEAILSDLPRPNLSEKARQMLKIVYTPLNGTGSVPVLTLLERRGFTDVHVVKEQKDPDPDFTTCPKPNPETESAWKLALKLAEEENADLVLATDPDADRLGLCVRRRDNTYQRFTGNMIGILLCDYVLGKREKEGSIPENGAIGTTIVSSRMGEALAKHYGVSFFETLTGFKYIGEKIREFEKSGEHTFLFGYEESLGTLVGTSVRDKDAISAAILTAEAAAYYMEQGKTLCDVMEDLFRQYGYYLEGQISVTFEGIDGIAEIRRIMEKNRTEPPERFAGKKVLALRDYKKGIRTDMEQGTVTALDLPSSDVLYYELENGWCAVRPSGTEPKIKYYFGIREAEKKEAERQFQAMQEALSLQNHA